MSCIFSRIVHIPTEVIADRRWPQIYEQERIKRAVQKLGPMDQGLVSKVDGSPCVPTDNGAETPGDSPAETKACAVTRRYYGLMDDEGADDFFIPQRPPPPTSTAPLLPAEGSTGGVINNSSVTHSTGTTDATGAKANPGGSGWHHGARQVMAAQAEVDGGTARTRQTEEPVDATATSNVDGVSPPTDEDQSSHEDAGCLMETCHDQSGGHHQTTKGKKSNEDPGEDIFTETDSNPVKEDCDRAGTNVPTRPSPMGGGDHLDSAANQPQAPETPAEEADGDAEHVDARSVNYNHTKRDWVRRESGGSETVFKHPNIKDSEGTQGEQGDRGTEIAASIQRGEQLLQRLQQVQQRQDGHMREVAQETRGEAAGELEALEDPRQMKLGDEAEDSPTEKQKNESNKARLSLSTESSVGDQRDRWVTADLPHPHETPDIPSVSTQHRFSVAETSMERQIQEENQAQQNLQRAEGVFNLTDNPDVLEIPFKTNISLEPFPSEDDPGQRSEEQLSEQEETNQEIQGEVVLVNPEKIPGGHSQGEIHKSEETKLLFQAFQQDDTEGPTRLRKHPAPLIRSALERTCSLERFPLGGGSATGAQSLRPHESEASERSPEYPRNKSPTGASRDKARLSPYPKQDKHPRLCRSMDSITPDASTAAAEARSKTREGRGESPILQRNPFFKLRPALALQPGVEKDIRDAREREEELRRQRCTLYGENRPSSREEKTGAATSPPPDVRKLSRGKLERVWPPPSKTDQQKLEQLQEPKVHRAGGQKAPLWQRWESGQINGDRPSEDND